jgi:AbrB family looped-hinge helix DNA binding protein
MNTTTTVDSAGRILLPESLREELRLGPGDTLEVEAAGEQITLRPLRGNAQVTKEKGVWVFRGGAPLPASVTDEILDRIREERDQRHSGIGE